MNASSWLSYQNFSEAYHYSPPLLLPLWSCAYMVSPLPLYVSPSPCLPTVCFPSSGQSFIYNTEQIISHLCTENSQGISTSFKVNLDFFYCGLWDCKFEVCFPWFYPLLLWPCIPWLFSCVLFSRHIDCLALSSRCLLICSRVFYLEVYKVIITGSLS